MRRLKSARAEHPCVAYVRRGNQLLRVSCDIAATSPPQRTRTTGGSNLKKKYIASVPPCPPRWRVVILQRSKFRRPPPSAAITLTVRQPQGEYPAAVLP